MALVREFKNEEIREMVHGVFVTFAVSSHQLAEKLGPSLSECENGLCACVRNFESRRLASCLHKKRFFLKTSPIILLNLCTNRLAFLHRKEKSGTFPDPDFLRNMG